MLINQILPSRCSQLKEASAKDPGVQEGEKWQRRRPRWLAITRVGADLLQRVAHCAYRPWASLEKTSIDLADLPDAYKVMHEAHEFLRVMAV